MVMKLGGAPTERGGAIRPVKYYFIRLEVAAETYFSEATGFAMAFALETPYTLMSKQTRCI